MSIGKLQRLPLRSVWPDEARDFTIWLEENIDVLSEVVGFDIENPQRETSTGNFSVDIMAQDQAEDRVVIENQLEESDHKHLGQLITYLASLEAQRAIWVVAEARPEHIDAVTLLNNETTRMFYLVQVEAVQIGESEPAPLLTLITGPSEEAEAIRRTKQDLSDQSRLVRDFWESFIGRAKERSSLHNQMTPHTSSWQYLQSGVKGVYYGYNITKGGYRIAIYIDAGQDKHEETEAIFRQLEQHRHAIEAAFGSELRWFHREGTRIWRIQKDLGDVDYTDRANWDEMQTKMLESMMIFYSAAKEYIDQIKLDESSRENE